VAIQGMIRKLVAITTVLSVILAGVLLGQSGADLPGYPPSNQGGSSWDIAVAYIWAAGTLGFWIIQYNANWVACEVCVASTPPTRNPACAGGFPPGCDVCRKVGQYPSPCTGGRYWE
jgi:hypothetical protein